MNLWLWTWRDGCLAWPILGHQGRQEKLARLADAADHHLLTEIREYLRKYFYREILGHQRRWTTKRIDSTDHRLLQGILQNILGKSYIRKYLVIRGVKRQEKLARFAEAADNRLLTEKLGKHFESISYKEILRHQGGG